VCTYVNAYAVTTLSTNIGHLTKLQQLDVSSNMLVCLPDLSMLTSLVRLIASKNRLTSLPMGISPSLMELDVSYAELIEFESVAWMDNCCCVEAHWLDIAGLGLCNSHYPQVGDNALTSLVPLASVTNLTSLVLKGNQLSELQGLPFGKLSRLSVLKLARNMLTHLPDEVRDRSTTAAKLLILSVLLLVLSVS
jgi:Leucine-rich repeat (LRR) protein